MKIKDIECCEFIEEKCEEVKENHLMLFHGTSVNNLKEIIKLKRIIPQGSIGSLAMKHKWGDYKDEDFYGHIFLSNDYMTAFEYSTIASDHTGEYYNENQFVVLAVEISKERLLPDLNDAEGASDWIESIARTNQVSLKGEIGIEDFRFVLVVDCDRYDVVDVLEVEDWEIPFKRIVEERKKRKVNMIL